MPALPRIPRAGRSAAGRGARGPRDSIPADRNLQDPRRLLRRHGAGGGLHLVGNDGHDAVAPPDALAGAVRTDVPRSIPHVLRRTGAVEPLCPAAQLPAPQGVVAGLHGRPADRRLRFGRLLLGRLRRAADGHAGRSEAQNPAGRKLCTVGSGGALRPEARKYGHNGDGRHEGLPRRDSQGGVPQNPVRRIRRRRDTLRIRHGRADFAGLFAGRQPLPLSAVDARHDPRRERSVRSAARGNARRAEHRRSGELVVAFIQTQDVGRVDARGAFVVEGRIDHSDIRGCNLLVQ